jgi:adenine-specific DNA methylase
MASDLEATDACPPAEVFVHCGDSRTLSAKLLLNAPLGGFDAVITSPPYPTEHDYTRNSRLELAYLECVRDKTSLREVKRGMVRSHTKGIYNTDTDDMQVRDYERLQRIVRRIENKVARKIAKKAASDKSRDCGFERLYGKVTQEYFGGMRRHFRAVRPLLKVSARCAYIVGDQSSYFQVKIPTAELLGEIAITEGFEVTEIRKWRERWSTGTKRFLTEHILLLRPSQSRNTNG